MDLAVDALLASHDPVMRAHAARGLGGARPAGGAIGKLAQAYAIEGDARVRRAIVDALSSRADALGGPGGRRDLDLAARLDPDRLTRWIAAEALAGREPSAPAAPKDVAWLRASAPDALAFPSALTGALFPNDGVAIPFAFDDDGYALVLGLPAGDARASDLRRGRSSVRRSVAMNPRGPTPPARPDAGPAQEGPSFETAIKRLSEIVQTLERGEMPLEESLRLFEEGVKLSRLSQSRLDAAEKRVEELLAVDTEGRARTAPFATDSKNDGDEDDGP